MWLTLCAVVALGSLPDLVVIVGTPWKGDAEIISRDLETYRDYWVARGIADSDVLVTNWTSPADASTFASKLKGILRERKSGRLAMFVSGHGVPVQEGDKRWIPALSFEKDAFYSWKRLFAELSIPAGWRALVVPDT